MFFESFFKLNTSYKEAHVCCPFPHKTEAGAAYFEERPSASVNTEKRLFHCSACGRGYSELQFVQNVLKLTTPQAHKLINMFNAGMDISEWNKKQLYPTGVELAESFGISKETMVELKLKSDEHNPDAIKFPVTLYNTVIDIRTYQPQQTPKVLSRTGACAGLALPEHGVNSNKVIFLCEGEKDMAMMRTHGLNGVTLTGGAGARPLLPQQFSGKKIAICYDNDDAGRAGAETVATILSSYALEVKVLTLPVKENKEDVTDYFTKYNGSKQELVELYKSTDVFIPCTKSKEKYNKLPLMSLEEAEKVENINKLIRTTIQVNGTNDDAFIVPTYINCVKVADGAGDLEEGAQVDWELNDDNLRDVAKICAITADDNSLRDKYKELCGLLHTEKSLAIKPDNYKNVYVANVMDIGGDNPREITVYSIGHKLESGHKYTITHKVVQSPKIAGLLLSICTEVDEASSTVDSFELNETTRGHLSAFQALGNDVFTRVEALTEKVKGLLGYNGNNKIIQAIDLAYHTPLKFNFGRFKNIRAYLDTIIVGESRVGKSSTAQTLLDHYKLGQFVSLAGNSATIPALIGGCNKTSSGQNQTKAGVIPMNHKGLVILEEFGKCANNIVSELTDIRSSNEVRINRVSGNLTLPAYVRMLTLSNVKPTSNGDIKPINSYPNGIAVLTELVPTAEDIARYDIALISAYKGDNQIDPFWMPDTPMTDEEYQTRLCWIWSRTPEQIKFTDEANKAIMNYSNMLNKEYECHIKIWGTEAWKKISRVAIAVAGYTVSATDDYNSILVTEECVDFAALFMRELYDNDTFRLKEYVNNERKYSVIDKNGVDLLGNMWFKNDTLLKCLDEEAQPTKNSTKAAAGCSEDDYNALMRELSRANMIQISGTNISPTVRFRKGMNLCKRSDWKIERCYEEIDNA